MARSGLTFRATIRKQGPNPYVDIPERVSRALASYAKAGRIYVEGTLDRAPIRATLIPIGGEHRLYVNGGMRAAAGVGVGDTVRFILRAVSPDAIHPPADLAAALRRARARASFDARTPSHRRELLRWVDDARTPESRRRRISEVVAQILGREEPRRGSKIADRPLWTCPKCGNAFVSRNIYHSCRRFELDHPFRGKPPEIRGLFDRLRGMVEGYGPVRVLPYDDHVGFMVQVRFAGATPRKKWLDVAFWLTRRLESPRFRRIETITPRTHLHLLRVTEPGQLDSELSGWLREAYDNGCRKHLEHRVAG